MDRTDIILRPYIDADKPAVIKLFVQLQEAENSVEPNRLTDEETAKNYFKTIENELKETEGTIYVAEYEQDVVGFVIVFVYNNYIIEQPGKHVYISDIVVDASARNKGIGQALMQQAETYTLDKGINEIRVSVLALNRPAIHLYERSGFFTRELEMAKVLPLPRIR